MQAAARERTTALDGAQPSGDRPAQAGPRAVSGILAALAFEAIVDAVIRFHAQIGVLPSERVSMPVRREYRDHAARLLNELDDTTRIAAEREAVVAARSESTVQTAVAAALRRYRSALTAMHVRTEAGDQAAAMRDVEGEWLSAARERLAEAERSGNGDAIAAATKALEELQDALARAGR